MKATALVWLTSCFVASAIPPPPLPPPYPGWKTNFNHAGMLPGFGESSPFALGSGFYLMTSTEGLFWPDDKCHSYFCVHDMYTGDVLSCPNASSGFAFFSAVTDFNHTVVWVFGSAQDRCTSGPGCKPFGCGPCDDASGKCYIGAWSSTGPAIPGGEWVWDGPFEALHLPPNVWVPNVGVGVVPAGTQVPGLSEPIQAFMALEGAPKSPAPGVNGRYLAVNTGQDGNLGTNWQLLNFSTHNVGPYEDVCQAAGCPAARWHDGYFYVIGGGVDLARSANLSYGSWSRPPSDPVQWGCAYGWEDCSNTSDYARIAPGFFTSYWAAHDGGRAFLGNLSEWNWSDSDVDFCDYNGTTYFIFDVNAQNAPANWTGRAGGFYGLGTFNGTYGEWLESFYAGPAPAPNLPVPCYDTVTVQSRRRHVPGLPGHTSSPPR